MLNFLANYRFFVLAQGLDQSVFLISFRFGEGLKLAVLLVIDNVPVDYACWHVFELHMELDNSLKICWVDVEQLGTFLQL